VGCKRLTACGLALALALAGASLMRGAETPAAGDLPPLERTAWTTSRVVGTPEPPLGFRAVPAFSRLSFQRPLYSAVLPGSERVLVVEQRSKVWSFENKRSASEPELFIEIADHDLYSLCFHPRFAENGYVYFFTNGPNSEKRKQNRIVRYTVTKDLPRRCDPESRHLVIEYYSNGHNGGEMGFGPDGMLYISSGDGTSDSDGDVTGQNITDLNSGMIRIDVEHPDPGRGYSVPKDNPFLDIPGAMPELWAYGFRNPWRMTFDRRTGDLWVGDIGQDVVEMVTVVKRGANYGWSVNEGSKPFRPLRERGPTPISPPTIEHPHSESRSVTGGIVYYGEKFPELKGAYLYGDYATGKIWGARYEQGQVTWQAELADTSLQILSFTEDQHGDVLIVDYGGHVYKLDRSPPVVTKHDFPRKLSETGLFASVAEHRPQAGLVPYEVNSPLWSDGAAKQRFIALPGMSTVEFTERGAWKFPEGAVLVKTFSLDVKSGETFQPRRIETRLMVFQQNEWVGYTYRWNDQQTDAELIGAAGRDEPFAVADPESPSKVRQQTWHYPSRAECMMCHTRAGQFVLGVSTPQLNRLHDYPEGRENQLSRLARLGVLRTNKRAQPSQLEQQSRAWRAKYEAAAKNWPKKLPPAMGRFASAHWQPAHGLVKTTWTAVEKQAAAEWDQWTAARSLLPKPVDDYLALADPYDQTADLQQRARSYLHSNCAHCHVEAGGGNAAINLNVVTALDKTQLIGVPPLHDRFGIAEAALVAPGAPERSILPYRLGKLGQGRMPPLGSAVVDRAAVSMLERWIKTLSPE
jgi:glucose/arabinose dehydrogenase